MSLTPSNMLPLGTKAPDFLLPASNFNRNISFQDVKGKKGTLVIFMCNHCPFVLACYRRNCNDSKRLQSSRNRYCCYFK